MSISEKEAFSILDLPLGVDKDAIHNRFKTLSTKLAASKLHEDSKKLEKVVMAYHVLIPPNSNSRHNIIGSTNERVNTEAASLSAIHALQRKAEKKKEKKQRKKDKKNKDKSEKFNANGKIGEDSDFSSNEAEEESYDSSWAYVNNNNHKISNGNTRKSDGISLNNIPMPERQSLARGMAVKGNEAASQDQHQKAVRLFTQAAEYDPTDHRFLGNRSFCYERLEHYDKALQDAEKAISLSPKWPKGYFRKGRALLGLSSLLEAERSFRRVLALDPECQEAREEIGAVQRLRLQDMGFTLDQATRAIAKFGEVQPALDALLAGEFQTAPLTPFLPPSPPRPFTPAHQPAKPKPPPPPPAAEDVKMNPRNPHGLTSLWVGNVLPEVTEKELQKLFAKYGHVSSVRQLKEKFCAFVNFTDSGSAGRAMTALQGHPVGGQRLLIKFPDNPISSGGQQPARGRRAPSARQAL